MEELKQLRLKEKLLKIELEAIQAKIKLYEEIQESSTVTFVPEKDFPLKTKANLVANGSSKDTSNPLIPVALGKSKPTILSTTSPDANGTGKGISNPLSPVALGKSKMTILSKPNLTMQVPQEFRPDYLQAIKMNINKYFYVIYDGPHKGVYTEWAIVEAHTKTDRVTCKKFKSLESANISLKSVEDSKWKFVQPKVRATRLNTRTSINFNEVREEEEPEVISFEDFRTLWSKARAADQEDFLHEKFFTEDKKTRSFYNFVEGADPSLVYSAFLAGLVKNIYPSNNLLELKNFPSEIIDSIKRYRKKVLQAKDSQIYINITSSIPDWSHEEKYSPYYLIEIGLANQKREFSPSEVMEELFPSSEKLIQHRLNSLKIIAGKLLKIDEEEKIKINFANSNCIITSWFPSTISKNDLKTLSNFVERISKNRIQACDTTRQNFCQVITTLFKSHHCSFCRKEDRSEGSSQSKASSEDKDARQEIMLEKASRERQEIMLEKASREERPTIHSLLVDDSLDIKGEESFPSLYKEKEEKKDIISTQPNQP